MDTSQWPLKWLNLFAIPIAIVMAIMSDSFWRYLMYTAATGFVIAGAMGTLFIGKLREQIANANPLAKLSAEIQGGTDTSLHIRFIFMQALSGALIISVWFAIASGVAYLFK